MALQNEKPAPKKPRAPAARIFLLPHHKIEIATMILANKDVLKAGVGLDSKTTNNQKNKIWQQIYDHVTSMGASIANVTHLRKNVYSGMKRATMAKKIHNDKTGVDPIPYTTLDELMFDIEGRDSNYMVGLGLDDSLSQFSTVSNESELDVSMQSSGDAPPSKIFFAPSETEGSVIASVAGTSKSSFAFNMPAEDDLMEPRSSSTPMLVDYNELDFTFARPATPKPHSGNVSRTNAVPVRNVRARALPSNTMEASIWADPDYITLKNDLMKAQLDETQTKAELNRAQTRAANEKAKFWERANAALDTNNIQLVLSSGSHLLQIQSSDSGNEN